jgi:hypothetical protein
MEYIEGFSRDGIVKNTGDKQKELSNKLLLVKKNHH